MNMLKIAFLIIYITGLVFAFSLGKLIDVNRNKAPWTPLVVGKFPKSSKEPLYFATHDHEIHKGEYDFSADKCKPWVDLQTQERYASNKVIRWCKQDELSDEDMLQLNEKENLYRKASLCCVVLFLGALLVIAYKML